VILGLAANFAEVFLPNYHREFLLVLQLLREIEQGTKGDFTIFALIIPSLTILAFLIQ
jgi:hypothetical protein